MKKLLSTMLAGSLLLGLSVPASAASEGKADTAAMPAAAEAPAAQGTVSDTLDARLAAVTQAVKAVLPIGDQFTDFNGEPDEGSASPRWSLHWSGGSESVSVNAKENGKVYFYNYYATDSDDSRFWGLTAAFPKDDKAQALAAAQAFADGLMGANESVKLKETTGGGMDSISYTGTLLFHGLPSPVTVRVTLRTGDLFPTRYSRSDNYSDTKEDVPSPQSKTSAAKAAELLRSGIKLEARYLRDQSTGSTPAKTASLHFVRTDTADHIVTAEDGKLVDLNKVLSDLAASYNGSMKATAGGAAMTENAAAAADSSGDSGSRLTDAELKSVESLKDVHTRAQLDEALRAVPELGLTSAYTLDRVSYSRTDKDDKITAALTYSRPLTANERRDVEEGYEDEILQVTKTVHADARTDELQAVYTSNYFLSRASRRSAQTAAQRTAAEAFLAKQFPEKWEACAPASSEKEESSLRYAQSVNGYPFPENEISIRMGSDGFVESLGINWDDEVKFASAEGILSDAEAVKAYAAAFDMPLCYTEYPVLENKSFQHKYVLAYELRQDTEGRAFVGIDAKTGEAVWRVYGKSSEYAYNDLAGSFGRTQIEALAAHGIGLAGESFQPKAQLDQKTMLALLLSACGHTIDLSSEEDLEDLYSSAYSEGLIKAADRSPNSAVTRITFLRTLIGASAYGEAARVPGIYTCPFADKAKLKADDLGYAALAYGLGVARGDELGRLNPDSTMTRQEAAVMLYNFMMR